MCLSSTVSRLQKAFYSVDLEIIKACLVSLHSSRTLVIPAIFGKTENGGQDLTAEKYSNKYIMLTWQQQPRTQATGSPCCALTIPLSNCKQFLQKKLSEYKATIKTSGWWWTTVLPSPGPLGLATVPRTVTEI